MSNIAIIDTDLLRDLEARADKHAASAQAFWEILAEIKDKRLYAQSHKNFAEYVKSRWNFGKSHAYRHLTAASVAKELSPMGEKVQPKNERAARSIAAASPAVVKAAIKEAEAETDAGDTVRVTTAHIKAAAEKAAPPAKKLVKAPERPKDGTGRVIKDSRLAKVFEDAAAFTSLANQVHAVKRAILELADTPLGRVIDKQRVEASAKDMVKVLKFAAPHAVCPQGANCGPRCKPCAGSGWVSLSIWEGTPKEVREAKG